MKNQEKKGFARCHMVDEPRDYRGDEGSAPTRVERDEQLRGVEDDGVDACSRSGNQLRWMDPESLSVVTQGRSLESKYQSKF